MTTGAETLMEASLRQDRDDARRALENASVELEYEKRTNLSLHEAYAEMKSGYEADLDTARRDLSSALVLLREASGRYCGYDYAATECPMTSPCWHHRRNALAKAAHPGTPATVDTTAARARADALEEAASAVECSDYGEHIYDIAKRLRSLAAPPLQPGTAPAKCEGCGAPPTRRTADDVELCGDCYESLKAEQAP